MEIAAVKDVVVRMIDDGVIAHGIQLIDEDLTGLGYGIVNRTQDLRDAAQGIVFLYFFLEDLLFQAAGVIKVFGPAADKLAPAEQITEHGGDAVLSRIRGTPRERPMSATSLMGNTLSFGFGRVSA